MRIIEQITNTKYLNLKKVIDPDNHVGGYFFAERLGVDSIAFVCLDSFKDQVLLNKEYKPPVDKFILSAFGGSIDKNKSIKQIVKDEVKEEAGFAVDEADIRYLGKVFVSTQMNQYCHLFVVLVDKKKQEAREPENAVEAMAETIWLDIDDLANPNEAIEDWKAITIMAKWLAG